MPLHLSTFLLETLSLPFSGAGLAWLAAAVLLTLLLLNFVKH